MRHVAGFACALLLLIAGCDTRGCNVQITHSTKGSGVEKTETRTVGAFDEVESSNGIEVDVDVGAAGPVELTGDDNLLPLIETEVQGHRLRVHTKAGASYDGHVRVHVPAKELKSASATSGSSLSAKAVKAPSFVIEATSGATLKASGASDDVRARVTSGATVDASGLEAKSVEIDASSGAAVQLHATESVTGSASSGASITVAGNPKARSVSQSSGGSATYR